MSLRYHRDLGMSVMPKHISIHRNEQLSASLLLFETPTRSTPLLLTILVLSISYICFVALVSSERPAAISYCCCSKNILVLEWNELLFS